MLLELEWSAEDLAIQEAMLASLNELKEPTT